MTEIKTTKVKYIVQYKVDGSEQWTKSDWNNGVKYASDLNNMSELLAMARNNMAKCFVINNGLKPKEYRLIKETHSITTEVVDE